MSRTLVAVALIAASGLVPLAAASSGWDWYMDGPVLVLLAVAAGYAAGAWLPRGWAAGCIAGAVAALVAANQLYGVIYHWLDDLVFFMVIVGGPAVAGAAVTGRAQQVKRLERLRAELDEQQRIQIATARLEEQNRVQGEVHARLAERIAGIALRAEGAQRSGDTSAVAVIEREAREVLDRLREALGSLRAVEPDQRPSSGPRESRTFTPFDFLVPAALAAAIAIESTVVPHARGPWWANALSAMAVAAPLVARRRHPIVATAVASALGVLMSAFLTPIPALVTGVALLVVLFYAVGAWCRSWWWLCGWGLATAGALGMEVVSGLATDADEGDDAWIVLLWTVGAVALGRITAGWQERLRSTRAVVDALESGRDAAVRLAVAKEREALASELHDTVAHAMTVVCLQAGAQQRSGGGSEPGTLQLIANIAEKSLDELRDGLEAMEAAEAPLDRSRIAAIGRRVGVDVDVTAVPVASGPAAVLAHRVIREAVVNIARHAPGAKASIRVEEHIGTISVEVLDDGDSPRGTFMGSGTGLQGLADAIGAAGGVMESGPRSGGGFRVVATIPQESA